MVQPDARAMTALLAVMRDKPFVPEGWDVALNLSALAVQSLVQSNWDAGTKAAADRALLWVAPDVADGLHDVIEVKSDLAPPLVSLSVADQAIQLHFALASGTLQFGKAPTKQVSRLRSARALQGEGMIDWLPPIPITPANPLQLSGTIPLAVEVAPAASGFSIALNPQAASLLLSGHADNVFSVEAGNQDLADWLNAHKLSDQLGSVAPGEALDATVLSPASVVTRIVSSLSGAPLLQILTGTPPSGSAPMESAPVPHPADHDFSVMVGSQAAMSMIVNDYNAGTGDIKLVSLPPSDAEPHWFAQVHEPMVFEGSFGRQDGETYFTDHSKLYIRFGGSVDDGLKLFTQIDPDSTIRLDLDLAAHYPLAITGTGTGQLVALQEGGQSVTANGFYEAIIQPQLAKFLGDDIRSDMTSVRMTAVSDLVLRDLTLSGHALQFDVAALPGELLIAGRLVATA